MAKKAQRAKQKKQGKERMAEIPEKTIVAKTPEETIVFGVNDPFSRLGLVVLALICVYGASKVMKTYSKLGISALSIYVVFIFASFFNKTRSPVCRANRWVRTFVPLTLFLIIYFTIYNYQTFQMSILVLSIVFGLVVLIQLDFPMEGFHFRYLLLILVLGCFSALYACEYDPKTQPFWFCFLTLFVMQMPIYFVNFPRYPGHESERFFSFY